MNPQEPLKQEEYVYSKSHKSFPVKIVLTILMTAFVFGAAGFIAGTQFKTKPSRTSVTETQQTPATLPTDSPAPSTIAPSPPAVEYKSLAGKFTFKHPKTVNDNPYQGSSAVPNDVVFVAVSNVEDETKTDNNWYIEIYKIPNAMKATFTSPTIPKDFFSITEPLKIDQTATVTHTTTNASFVLTRQKNTAVESLVANVYQTDGSVKDLARTRYAVFQSEDGQSSYIIAIHWTNPKNDYLFSLVTGSFEEDSHIPPSSTTP